MPVMTVEGSPFLFSCLRRQSKKQRLQWHKFDKGSLQSINPLMSQEGKMWTEEQDHTLRRLYEEEGIKNWSEVAHGLHELAEGSAKTARQCKERYENYLCEEAQKIGWSPAEERALLSLHDQHGNKWSVISRYMPGRTDNCVKNHFYSRLRKSLRKVNGAIQATMKKMYRPLQMNTIYKIVEATEEMFREEPCCSLETSAACKEVQNRLLKMSIGEQKDRDDVDFGLLVKDIMRVSKMYKRKNKKIRNASVKAVRKSGKRIEEGSSRTEQAEQQPVIEVEEQPQGFKEILTPLLVDDKSEVIEDLQDLGFGTIRTPLADSIFSPRNSRPGVADFFSEREAEWDCMGLCDGPDQQYGSEEEEN